MKVRMLTTKAGPDGGWNAGQVMDHPDGEKLVTDGLAVPHKPFAKIEQATGGPQRKPEPTGSQSTTRKK
jgi:hypothetical protein